MTVRLHLYLFCTCLCSCERGSVKDRGKYGKDIFFFFSKHPCTEKKKKTFLTFTHFSYSFRVKLRY